MRAQVKNGEGRNAHVQDEAWWLLACEGPREEQERREGNPKLRRHLEREKSW